MTENTPTSAELVAEARSLTRDNWGTEGAIVDRLIDALEAVTVERDAASRDATELARELAALTEIPEEDLLDVTTQRDALLAERDALSAIIAEAQEQAAVSEDETLGKWAYRSRLMILHRDVLSKLPADALAARDARVLREAAGDVFDTALPADCARYLEQRADRIEREASA